jgi:hypothetical protein
MHLLEMPGLLSSQREPLLAVYQKMLPFNRIFFDLLLDFFDLFHADSQIPSFLLYLRMEQRIGSA